MHTSPLPAEIPTKIDNPLDEEPPTRPYQSKSKFSEASDHVTSSIRFVAIPLEFEHYICTANHSSEVYSAVKHSREYRLRLLLRRLTNQIQYGCKNTLCDTPTCLSYRKRRSRVPVRPYNDLAARSLAWQLAEDYISVSGDSSLAESSVHTQKRSLKPRLVNSSNQSDGLCPNEPVIPWYEHPHDYNSRQRKSHATSGSVGSRQGRTSPGEKLEVCELEEQRELRPGGDLAGNMNVQRSSDITSKLKTLGRQPTQTYVEGTAMSAEFKDCRTIPSERTVRFEDETRPLASFQQLPIDNSSFLQTLFDLPSLRAFGAFRSGHWKAGARELSASRLDLPQTTEHADDHPAFLRGNDCEKPIGHVDRIKALSLLPLKVLEWLVQHSSKRFGQQPVMVKFLDEDRVSLFEFARQSLYYCLSHPLRLIASAELWGPSHVEGQESRENPSKDDEQNKTAPHTQACVGSASKPHHNRPYLPRMQDAAVAFGLMSHFQSHTELVEHIFSALQGAYVMPDSPRRTSTTGSETHVEILANRPGLARRSEVCSLSPEEPPSSEYLHDDQVAFLCVLAALSLNSSSSLSSRHAESPSNSIPYHISCITEGRAFHHTHARSIPKFEFGKSDLKPTSYPFLKNYLAFYDAFDEPYVLRSLCNIADIISHRIALQRTLTATHRRSNGSQKSQNLVDHIVVLLGGPAVSQEQDSYCLARYLLDLMFVVLIKVWDRKSVVSQTSAVGGALQLLAALFRNKAMFHLKPSDFELDFVANCFDDAKMPLEWLAFREDNKRTHILSFPFLFKTATLVKYFRASNIEVMRKAFEYARITYSDTSHFLGGSSMPVQIHGAKGILASLRPHMARYFVVTVRRSHIVEDAINQIWRRQRQELMRPLKISLGKEEGEDGLDHGGVQQEFFRIVFAEMLNPDYGMFNIDEKTRMTWFQPASLEPLYKFEALGILMSLAVYNAVTLPITFPVAFYRKLLGHKVKSLEHIEDGWPELVRGLRVLQTWSDGDVGDIIARTYEFSYHVYGSDVSIDMTKVGRNDPWPPKEHKEIKQGHPASTFTSYEDNSAPVEVFEEVTRHSGSDQSLSQDLHSELLGDEADEAPLVTNDNRERYIKDYIHWLAHKSISPQFAAFAKGFHTCLDATALSIFTPEALKSVIEGETFIDIQGLRAATSYDDYSADDPTVSDFWYVVDQLSVEQHRKLLEFVTASDRVPVSGIESVTFVIQRNGEGDDRLPSSSTCYGRLLLPKYSNWKILKEKLEKAIENSVGFGSL